MTNSIDEFLDADVVLIVGSNTTENHPVIGAKVRQAKNKGAKIIVVDPRKIDISADAEIHLQLKPGTNVAFANGMMNVILNKGLENKAFIEERMEDFEKLKKAVEKYTPEVVAEICEVDPEDIIKAAELYATAEKGSIIYCMGVTQHSMGTNNVMSMANLANLCGHMGRESTGVNPLRGQNNVQGACDMGALPTSYPAYQAVSNPEIAEKFGKAWGVESLSTVPGLTIVEMLNAVEKGDIKMLYIMGENPMVSDPDLNHVKHALESSDFLVVQDIFLTETAELADVVLPAASFAEKDGTFSNTERRVQRIRKAVDAPGEARPDWVILMEIMNRLGYDKKYNSAEEIFDELRTVTPSYAGITYDRIEKLGIQWPCPNEDHPGTKFLHSGKFARGKGLFVGMEYQESAEMPDEEYPLILTTGRLLYQYHTRSMSGRVEGLNKKAPESFIEIHPDTASSIGVIEGDMVKVASRRGSITVKARVSDIVDKNVVFIPFHFAEGAANKLTNAALDPKSKIPEYKVCAVQIEKSV